MIENIALGLIQKIILGQKESKQNTIILWITAGGEE